MHLVSWDNAVNRDRAELIFTNRNHEYGAYVIRRDYDKIVVYALLYTLAGIALIVAIPSLLRSMSDPIPIKKDIPYDPTVITTQPIIDKPIPIIQRVIPQPPLSRSLIFVPSHITPDQTIDEPTPDATQLQGSMNGKSGAEEPSTVDAPSLSPVIETEVPPVMFAQEMPVFPGGELGLMQYLADHIKYSAKPREIGVEGTVYISFVVDKEGKVKDAKVIKGVGWGLNEEALRVISTLPQWRPGKQNGSPVSVIYHVPVRFSLK